MQEHVDKKHEVLALNVVDLGLQITWVLNDTDDTIGTPAARTLHGKKPIADLGSAVVKGRIRHGTLIKRFKVNTALPRVALGHVRASPYDAHTILVRSHRSSLQLGEEKFGEVKRSNAVNAHVFFDILLRFGTSGFATNACIVP